jgi:glutathione S-transferase
LTSFKSKEEFIRVMATQDPAQEKARPKYSLLYHGGIPGRGEFVRLAFEAAGIPYDDPGNAKPSRANEVYAACSPDSTGVDGNPPAFSPPMLKVQGAGDGGKPLLLSQTPNILLYLGPALGLAGDRPIDAFYVNELALAALDLNNACHDTHHPISAMKYYEDQKDEALLRAADFREHRIPKYFSYFERVLEGNESAGHGRYMVGAKLTYADLTLWQVLDG